MTVGQRIREERKALDLSQEALAARCGVSRRSQIMYEQDSAEASAGYFTKIAEAGADVAYILTGVRKGGMGQKQSQGPQLVAVAVEEPSAVYPAMHSLTRQKERLKALIDEIDDPERLRGIQKNLEDLEWAGQIEDRITALEQLIKDRAG